MINNYSAGNEKRKIAEKLYNEIQKYGLNVFLIYNYDSEPDEESYNNPANFKLHVESIQLGPFADGRGDFISIDGEKSLSARYAFEMTESVELIPYDYYTISFEGAAVDINLGCRVIHGSESLMDGHVDETEGSDNIHIHLEGSGSYCESDVIGKHDVKLDNGK